MVLCTICDEGIPKPGRRAHGKKPVNCGGACLTAYVEEHTAACQGKKVAYGTGMAPIPDEEASRAKSWNNSEDCSNGANKVFTEILNLKNSGDYRDAAFSDCGSTNQTIEASPHADLAEVNSDAAQGILDMIKGLIHMPELTNCRNCNKTKQELGIKKIRKCKGCALVGYCGAECQRQHWDSAHRRECKTLCGIGQLELSKADVEERLRWLES